MREQLVDNDPSCYIKSGALRESDIGIGPDAGDDGIDHKAGAVASGMNDEPVPLPLDAANALAKSNIDAMLAEIDVQEVGERAWKKSISDAGTCKDQ